VPRPARTSQHPGHDRRATSGRRLVSTLQGTAELPLVDREVGEFRLPRPDAAPRHGVLASGSRDHAGAMSLPAARPPAKVKSSTKGYCMPSFHTKRRVVVLAALALAGLARPSAAQTYPTQN